MYYENTETGEFGITLNDVRRSLPHMSIPDTTEEVDIYKSYLPTAKPQLEWNQDAEERAPVDGRQVWVIVTADTEELQRRIDAKVDLVRSQREPLLRACDWTQLTDVPLSAEKIQEWRDYRQALRDVTSQVGFPWTIMWPTPPADQE